MKVMKGNMSSYFLIRLGCVVLLALGLSGFVPAQGQTSSATARVWEGPLNIPTYELSPPNPYPALLDWQRRCSRGRHGTRAGNAVAGCNPSATGTAGC